MNGHTPTIAPNSAPEGLVFRVVDHDGAILDEERVCPPPANRDDIAVAQTDIAELGLRHNAVARQHAREGEPAYVYIYDGDSGECVKTIIVEV